MGGPAVGIGLRIGGWALGGLRTLFWGGRVSKAATLGTGAYYLDDALTGGEGRRVVLETAGDVVAAAGEWGFDKATRQVEDITRPFNQAAHGLITSVMGKEFADKYGQYIAGGAAYILGSSAINIVGSFTGINLPGLANAGLSGAFAAAVWNNYNRDNGITPTVATAPRPT